MNINKKEALKRLSALENEVESLKKIIEKGDQYTLDDLSSYEDACKILNISPRSQESVYSYSEWFNHQLLTIIKAANFIDNNYKEYTPDFINSNTAKYIPYLEIKSSGWVLSFVHCNYGYTHAPFGFYYKERSTAEVITKRFLFLYNQVWG